MAECIAVLKAGSSSIKFALFEADGGERLLYRGQLENIGVSPRLSAEDASGKELLNNQWAPGEIDHRSGTKIIVETANENA